MIKSIRERIQELEIPELREKLIERVTEEPVLNSKTDDITPAELLCCAFCWRDSPEGHEYWEGIHTMLLQIYDN